MRRYPFKFLNAYDSDDTDIFFGREEEIEQLYQMAFQTDLLLVYGASGTGKTSLINCGLASRFQRHDWLALTVRRGHDLNASLRDSLQAAIGEGEQAPADIDLDWLDEDDDEADEAGMETSSELSQQFKDIYRTYFRPIYLIFDQFEELYILGEKAEQEQFVETVEEILQLDQPVKCIFIIREEYLGHLFDFERAVPQLLRKKLRIEAMNLDKVRQVIEGAAAVPESNIQLQAGEEAAISEGIFNKIKGEINTLTIQLPYLQVFLDKLYLHITGDENRQSEARFSKASLTEIGDIDDVLRDFLEEQVLRIQHLLDGRFHNVVEDAIWKMLSLFVTLDGTKEPLSLSELQVRLADFPDQAIRDALQELETSRILRYEESRELYEIAHDSLALRIAERRSDEEIALLEIRRLIKSQTSLQAEARELFTEKQLNFIDPYLDRLALTTEEQDLINTSLDAVKAQRQAEKQKADAELAALQERQRLLLRNQKNQRRFLAIMAIALIGMIILSYWAVQQQQQAKDNATTAQQRLEEIQKTQALAKANEFKAFGDSYADLGESKRGYACQSYQEALGWLDNYEDDPLFQEILDKQNKTCK